MKTLENKQPEIDLVYLWVDGNDPEWRAKRNALIGATEDTSATNCDGRYADNDELRYSLRSAELYAPWIRRIYIVTDKQVPRWLDTRHSKIRIVDHSEILPPESLPTFNSTVIEHALHRIPDLAEHFLYANDDMYFNRPVAPSDFFTSDGKPIVRFNRRPFRKLTLLLKDKLLGKKLSNYNLTIQNAARLIEKRYGRYIGHKTHHNIDAYNRSAYEQAFEAFRADIEPVMANHVRADNDIQRNLYSYFALMERKAVKQFVTQKTSFRLHIDKPSRYAKLEKHRPMLFCLNDSQYATDHDRLLVAEFLKRKFPDKSSFENLADD